MNGDGGNHSRSHENYPTVVPGVALFMGVMKDKKTFIQEWTTHDQVKCVVNYSLHRISLYFTADKQEYKAEFSFNDLVNRQMLADYLPRDDNQNEAQQQKSDKNNKKQHKEKSKAGINYENALVLFFTFHLKYPPEYWRLKEQGPTNQQNRWSRVTQIPSVHMNSESNTTVGTSCEPVCVGQQAIKCMRLGSWIVLRMSFSNRAAIRKKYDEVLSRGKQHRLVRQLYPRQLLTPIPSNHSDSPQLPSQLHHQDDNHCDDLEAAEFTKFYALQYYISRYQFNEHNLNDQFYNEYAKLSPDKTEEALRYMWATMTMEHGHRKTLGELLKLVCEKYLTLHPKETFASSATVTTGVSTTSKVSKKDEMKKQQQRLIQVNKISVTPTSVRVEPRQRESANRVLLKYNTHLDRFLRVQFIDENGGHIHASSKPYHELYRRIKHVLKNGIDIHGRHYTFLAFSSSQLREHGCWFFANTMHMTADQIRTWMGDFSKEKVVATYAARMGQCFSSTQPITKISNKKMQVIPDILSKDKKYKFSDGVGWISRRLANTIVGASHRNRGKNNKSTMPSMASAFQIRWGGAKGVLTVVPGKKFKKNKQVAFRPSQIKFQSKHKMLEVIRVSHASMTYLNRQIISLLSSLGVPNFVFLTLLDMMRKTLDKMLRDSFQCAQMLRAQGDEFGIHGQIARLVEAGFLDSGDPFVKNLVNMFRVSKLNEAKKKARIPVQEAVSALGVLDETNTLKEGQIFCQLSDRKKKIIHGPCVLYRCPSLHPGDIRMVEAVDCPALRDLYDVIVFSQQGKRDLPSMCSGGDLDGDIYSIIWDEELFPVKQDTPPMGHETDDEDSEEDDDTTDDTTDDNDVTIDDIENFFIDYITNDNLGLIANAHMAIADSSAKYACDEKCIKLAELHSVAVDFPKTGVVAHLPDHLRPKNYPDFMEKTDKANYPSNKILGELYRSIDDHEIQHYKTNLELKTVYDTRMHVDGMEKYIWEARELKEQYDQEVREIMNQYGVATESELVSGSIVKWLKREDGPEKFHEVRHEARREITRLRDDWRRLHFPALNASHHSERVGRRRNKSNNQRMSKEYTREEKRQEDCKAAAWYYVTYHRAEQYDEKKRMLSFPWVAQEILCRLAKMNRHSEKYTRAIPELDIVSFRGESSRTSSVTKTTAPTSSVKTNRKKNNQPSSTFPSSSTSTTASTITTDITTTSSSSINDDDSITSHQDNI
ncbi:RNA dependent RNA polymerase-domain-containing protein [Phascolomyces articulosus]|uniref:RNA-dependent RNA polymerase n=1 Tax=Phascolomyces articulosus TaxID=60185 RepID=A0AAD5JM08_9FUNG|nr:RNA dependent RNA polymerase-domain-containing protein [Phascolomyces articulosus]